MDNYDIDVIADRIIEKISEHRPIPIEVSGRHVHLSQRDLERLLEKIMNLQRKKNFHSLVNFRVMKK